MNAALARVLHMVTLGSVKLVDDTQARQTMQVQETARPGEVVVVGNAPRMTEFGFTSNPPLNSRVLIIRPFGNRALSIVIGTGDAATRLKNLSPGDAALYDARGAYVWFQNGGLVIDGGGLPMTVRNVGTLNLVGDLHVTGDVVAHSAGAAVSLTGHRHPLTGGPVTGAPLPQ